MPLTILRQDITKMKVDAIVNAANTELKMGGGVCGAIFKAAGALELQSECEKLAPIRTGSATLTKGYSLFAKYIIHAVGPVYTESNSKMSEILLHSAYSNSLKLARKYKCNSIAFPLISSGVYGYPKEEALRVATSTIKEFLAENEMNVFLVVFDKAAFEISEKLIGEVKSYIDEHYVGIHEVRRQQLPKNADFSNIAYSINIKPKEQTIECIPTQDVSLYPSFDNLFNKLDEPFSQLLLRLIDAKKMSDVEVYKRANLDRKLFSKIRSNKGYAPSKRTAIALAIAMRLSLEETNELLERAGYALSRAFMFDVIVEYFIRKGRYDVFEINEVLFSYDQSLLGG